MTIFHATIPSYRDQVRGLTLPPDNDDYDVTSHWLQFAVSAANPRGADTKTIRTFVSILKLIEGARDAEEKHLELTPYQHEFLSEIIRNVSEVCGWPIDSARVIDVFLEGFGL